MLSAIGGRHRAACCMLRSALCALCSLQVSVTGVIGRGASGIVYKGLWRGLLVRNGPVLWLGGGGADHITKPQNKDPG